MRISRALVAFLALLLAALVVVSCDDGDSNTDTTDTVQTGPPPDALDAYFAEDLPAAAPRETPPPLPSTAYEDLLAELRETVRVNNAAAAALSDYSDFTVTAEQVANVDGLACRNGPGPAVEALASLAPRADLNVINNVNEMAAQVSCDQAAAEVFAAGAFNFLLRNTTTVPSPAGPPSPGLEVTYDAACRGLKSGLAKQINRRLKIKGPGRFGVSLTVGAALSQCDETLSELFSGVFD